MAKRVRTLAMANPELLPQWHPSKNGKLRPDQIAAGSKQMVWWRCPNGHEWQDSVANRRHTKHCPRCTPSLTSIPEQWLYSHIRKVFPDAINGAQIVIRHKHVEFDIFIPTIQVAVEYDGFHHAQRQSRDEEKNRLAESAGILLIRVRQSGLPILVQHGSKVTYHTPDNAVSLAECLIYIGQVLRQTPGLTDKQIEAIHNWKERQEDFCEFI